MQATKRRPRGAGRGNAAESTRSRVGLRGRFGAGRARFGIVEDGLGHRGRLILGHDDAAVAGELEVNLRERTIVTGPWG